MLSVVISYLRHEHRLSQLPPIIRSKQHNEKLIPTVIRKAVNGENIPIYGDVPKIYRLAFVLDHCKASDLVTIQVQLARSTNIGGRKNATIINIADKCEILDELRPKQRAL